MMIVQRKPSPFTTTAARMLRPRSMLMKSGYLVAEVVLGMTLIGIIIVALSMMVTRQNKAAGAMAAQRELSRAAEQALLATQSPEVPPPGDVQLAVTILDHPSPVEARRWITLTATRDNRSASITGLARADLLPRVNGGQP
jgi:hypothetical protein